MTLTADSGSTKTTWLVDDGACRRTFRTRGINPVLQTEDAIRAVIQDELLPQDGFPSVAAVHAVRFYGAGCNSAKAPLVAGILRGLFTEAAEVEVDSDMLGAAKALCGTHEGIACILGTGSNSCLYDGSGIVANVSPMGYILGDEGSGAVLGRTFVNLIYKGGHEEARKVFESETGLTQADIIQRVYREAMPNRFLASLAPGIRRYADEWEWVDDMVTGCFRLFFRHNVRHYARPDLPCSFVGSIAYYFERQLRRAANEEGFLIGVLMKEPLG